jgi:pyrrolidone-carboxylate peptidase
MTRLQKIVKQLAVVTVLASMFVSGCGQREKILLTGYWPPTNEMLIPFSNNPDLNPAGWQGENWQGLDYDVYAYFPTFEGGTEVNPKGDGDFEVDYQDTYSDFQRIVKKLKPVIIISYGRGAGPWEIETKAVNRAKWYDDYSPPIQPDVSPPIETLDVNEFLVSSLPFHAIANAVNDAVPEINAWVDEQGDPGNFLCNYIGLLGLDYVDSQTKHDSISGFIHVGPYVTIEQAAKANEITLRTVIEYLKTDY